MSDDLIAILNRYGSEKEPFFFMISYDLNHFIVEPLKTLSSEIKYEINTKKKIEQKEKLPLIKLPETFETYEKKFNRLQEEITAGNTYLLNLTTQTKIHSQYSLNEIYEKAHAKFKLKYNDEFVCFSPERFIKIHKNKIYTYPMKGTIDANIPNAQAKILGDIKEMAEHTMVVDLLRNDLSIVSSKVRVDTFRYCETIHAGEKTLLQISSKISGHLPKDWSENIGNILTDLLPAGSITGTPKKKTVEILNDVEGYNREYYSGVFGVYDGQNLDSAVMIRFIQKDDNHELWYKSGGGITCDSNVYSEYQELLDKIYIPS
ncbi:MAG: aminodeoxychorismate synthase component I [Candidatus Marinarcus sp.]|uniref:aminodeoxychorismate synthase component I n=1 Tax=Candidatus Marinarcus sp. TaxID=3100987 RepID=UPI003AFFD47E